MGLGNHEGGSTKYVNVANGKMNFKVDGEKRTADYLEGIIEKIGIEEVQYEGKPIRKVVADVRDGEDLYRLQFTLDAWFSVGFFAPGHPAR